MTKHKMILDVQAPRNIIPTTYTSDSHLTDDSGHVHSRGLYYYIRVNRSGLSKFIVR